MDNIEECLRRDIDLHLYFAKVIYNVQDEILPME